MGGTSPLRDVLLKPGPSHENSHAFQFVATGASAEIDDDVQFISSASRRGSRNSQQEHLNSASQRGTSFSNAANPPSLSVEPVAPPADCSTPSSQQQQPCDSSRDEEEGRSIYQELLDMRRTKATNDTTERLALSSHVQPGSPHASLRPLPNVSSTIHSSNHVIQCGQADTIICPITVSKPIREDENSNKKRRHEETFGYDPRLSQISSPAMGAVDSHDGVNPRMLGRNAYNVSKPDRQFENGCFFPDYTALSVDHKPNGVPFDHLMINEALPICCNFRTASAMSLSSPLSPLTPAASAYGYNAMQASSGYGRQRLQHGVPKSAENRVRDFAPSRQHNGRYIQRSASASNGLLITDRNIPISSPSNPSAQHRYSNVTVCQPTCGAHAAFEVQPPIPGRSNAAIASSFDKQRRPSLYNVPAWTSPPVSPKTVYSQAPNVSLQRHVTGDGFGESNLSLLFEAAGRPQSPNHGNLKTATSDKKFRPVSTSPPNRLSMQGVRRKKHSPNLIVDIAETCQENFPFAEIAARHQQPIQKVLDTFSAIVQLPLLRSADDKRRHGSLGKRRMKEFRDARKAMEIAQEEQRRAQRAGQGSSTGIGSVSRKPTGQSKAPLLLKAAILNNVHENQGASIHVL